MSCEGQNRQGSETESLGWWALEMVRCEEPVREERWHLATTALLSGLQPRGTKEGGLFGQISQACLSIRKSEALAWDPGPEILPLHRHGLVSESPRTPGSGGFLGWVGSAATPRSPRQGTATLTLRV